MTRNKVKKKYSTIRSRLKSENIYIYKLFCCILKNYRNNFYLLNLNNEYSISQLSINFVLLLYEYKGLLNIPKKEVSQKFTFSFISILLLTPIKSFIRQHAKEDEKIDGERLRKRAQLIERIAFLTGRSSRRLERREGSLIKR